MYPAIECTRAALQPGRARQLPAAARDAQGLSCCAKSPALPGSPIQAERRRQPQESHGGTGSMCPAASSRRCQGRPLEPAPLTAAQAWLHSLSYLYSWVAARLQNVLIKIKLKKKKQLAEAVRGQGRLAEGQTDRPVSRDERGRAGAVWERSGLKPSLSLAKGWAMGTSLRRGGRQQREPAP